MSRQIAHASSLYGTFAIVLIAWLYLQAQLTLNAVEINVVRAYRLWPRSLAPPLYTEQDRRAFRLYTEKRSNQGDTAVEAGYEDDRETTPGWPGRAPRGHLQRWIRRRVRHRTAHRHENAGNAH